MDRRIFLTGLSGISVCTFLNAVASDSADGEWGDLKGRFMYDGEPPEPKRLEVTKDVAFVKQPLFNASLLVNKENRGLANVVVTLRAAKAGELPPIHPSYEKTKLPPVEMTFRRFAIAPRVTVLRTGQELVHVNVDPVGHNPKFELRNNRTPSIIFSRARETISTGYKAAEATPVSVCCSIHPWESAVLVVADHPYVGVSRADGSFVVKDLSVGQWTFHLWHERCQGIKQATIGGMEQKLDRGKLMVEIKPGVNDLGEIKVEPKLLEGTR